MRYLECMHYFAEIDKAILMINEDDVTSDIEYLDELDEEIPNILGDGMTYRERSPFGKHFHQIFNKCKVLVDNLENKYNNHSFQANTVYYFPNFPEFLITYYMPICPLWTGLILGPALFPNEISVTFTNSSAENWMRIVKRNILR